MDDGTESQTVSPRLRHVGHANTRVSECHLLTKMITEFLEKKRFTINYSRTRYVKHYKWLTFQEKIGISSAY